MLHSIDYDRTNRTIRGVTSYDVDERHYVSIKTPDRLSNLWSNYFSYTSIINFYFWLIIIMEKWNESR